MRVSYLNKLTLSILAVRNSNSAPWGHLIWAHNQGGVEIKCESKGVVRMQQSETVNAPEKKFSTGVISATIWKNSGTSKKGEPVEFKTISLQRRYTDEKGEWNSTSSLRINDLPKASLVLNKAYEYLVLKEQADSLESAEISEEIIY